MANSGDGWSPGKIKPGGWLVIIIIITGSYWLWAKPHMGSITSLKLPFGPSSGMGQSGQSNSNGSSGGDIVVLTTGTKKTWLSEEIGKFNNQTQSGQASLDIMESRDGMQKILAGAEQSEVWSPSSTVWTDRLADIGPAKGIHIHQDNDNYRTLFQSPLVFLVQKVDLNALTPILTGRHPFTTIARGEHYKFAYANPLNASSGMLTMTLLLNEYADIVNSGDLDACANSDGFKTWLRKVDRGLETDNTEGSSQLEKDFTGNPGDRAFITAYENAAVEDVVTNPNLAIIYPNPTAEATQVAVAVDGPWSTDAKKATAKAFLDFITSDAATSDAVDLYFRPAVNGGDALAQKVQPTGAEPYYQVNLRVINPPSYNAINDANVVFHQLEH